MRERLLAPLQQCKDPVLSRDALLLRAGLSFFADDLNVDLALMQFVRDGWLVPIADRPFTFALNLTHLKGAPATSASTRAQQHHQAAAHSCLQSESWLADAPAIRGRNAAGTSERLRACVRVLVDAPFVHTNRF